MIKLKQVIHDVPTNSVEATWVDVDGNQVKCHSYSDRQMDMLRADLGADAATHADLIAEVEANMIPVPPATPQAFVCSPWQIRKALSVMGLRDAVESAITASTDITLKDGWEFATEFRSDDPFVIAMGVALGKSEAETADLIQLAAGL